jgi:hypothetical protein
MANWLSGLGQGYIPHPLPKSLPASPYSPGLSPLSSLALQIVSHTLHQGFTNRFELGTFALLIFSSRVSLFPQGWTQMLILLPMASHVAGMTGTHHHTQLMIEMGSH